MSVQGQRISVDQVDLDALRAMSAEDMLRYTFETFGSRAAIGTSLQKTGIVMVHLASGLGVPYRVFFVDTLLNHKETYELLDRVEHRFGIGIERFAPTDDEIEELYRRHGQHTHYFARELCCHTRKQVPLHRALATLDVWVSGLRADQSDHREATADRASIAATPDGRVILKLNPLLEWTEQQIDQYTRDHELPYNALYDYVSAYDERYGVIGCEPCHVPTKSCLPARAGKFPWEQGHKECGIHDHGGGI